MAVAVSQVVWLLLLLAGGYMTPQFLMNTTNSFDPPKSSPACTVPRTLPGTIYLGSKEGKRGGGGGGRLSTEP